MRVIEDIRWTATVLPRIDRFHGGGPGRATVGVGDRR